MPEAPLRPCHYPGCSVLVRRGYCSAHQSVVDAGRVRTDEQREVHRLYGRPWKRIRAKQLADHPWCAQCEREGRLDVPAIHVHHKSRHRGDAETFYRSELESLCHSCHSRETAIEIKRGRGVEKDFAY